MPGFLTPIDIANRAMQHCGVDLIDQSLGFTEQSDRAAQAAFCYDKLRRSELRRNTWQFAIRRSVIRPIIFPNTTDPNGNLLQPTLLLEPELWQSATTYFLGQVVADSTGAVWVSQIADNIGNAPGLSTNWDSYFGPSCATPYDVSGQTSYFAGDVVYITTGNGVYTVYQSRINSNQVVPTVIDAWLATSIYMKDSIVSSLGVNYQSLIDVNINNQPSATTAPPNWVATTTYALNALVAAIDGNTYKSLANGNVNNNPPFDNGVHWQNLGPTPWTTVLTRPLSADEWMVLQVGLQALPQVAPLGIVSNISSVSSGPTRNVYPLPVNFLRLCAQDPKQGSVSFLGAPSGNQYLDWVLDGPYLVTRTNSPIVLRFVADITHVREMDDMFCEGLGARIGYEVCPKLTQSIAKRQDIATAYKTFMGEARIVNGIEEGATEPPEDDFITSRL